MHLLFPDLKLQVTLTPPERSILKGHFFKTTTLGKGLAEGRTPVARINAAVRGTLDNLP